MILSMSAQVYLFSYTVLIGAFTGLLYDLIRLLRRQIKHSQLISNIEDGVYWICVSLVVFYFMLNRNYGEIRLFSIVGFFVGMILYFLTISRFVLLLLTKIVGLIKNVLLTAFKILTFPLRILVNLIKIPIGLLMAYFGRKMALTKKVLQKSKRYAKIKKKKLVSDINVIFKKV